MTSSHDLAASAAAAIASSTGVARHDIALVLGSGWGDAAGLLGDEVAAVAPGEVPGFKAAAVQGHHSELRSILTPSGTRVLVLGARQHFYESRDPQAVVHGVRTAAAAGCRTIVLTNGCGSTRPEVGPGTPVLLADHINYTGATPLTGATFIDMTDVYSRRLRALAREVDPSLVDGVYIQFSGPQYETPAEVRMAATMGANLIGMSTALEAIAAREAGLEILGLSLVTNFAAGITGGELNHREVLEAGREAGPRISRLLADIVGRMSWTPSS